MYRNFNLLLIVIIIVYLVVGCLMKKESLSFEDNFENYTSGEYPSSGGWYQLWSGAGNTNVVSGVAYSGEKSFKLSGYPNWIRADGKNIDISDVDNLTYEFSIMIPAGSVTGGIVGFFVKLSSNESRDYNLVHFCFQGNDSVVVVKGNSAIRTSFIWDFDTWYSVKVELDYVNLKMNVWINGQQVATDIEAASRTTSNIFCLETEWYSAPYVTGTVYFDDIKIYETQ